MLPSAKIKSKRSTFFAIFAHYILLSIHPTNFKRLEGLNGAKGGAENYAEDQKKNTKLRKVAFLALRQQKLQNFQVLTLH